MKKSATRFTLETRKQLELLLKQGLTLTHCSKIMGIGLSVLSYERQKSLNSRDYSAEEAHRTSINLHKRRGIQGYTAEQKNTMETLFSEGNSAAEIARRVGCGRNGVMAYLCEGTKSRKKEADAYASFHDRISCLEMQIQILTQQIKELLCQK